METLGVDEVMDQYARGDGAAFDLVYEVLGPPLYSFCLRLTGRRAEAEDVCQDAFLRIHRSRSTYRAGRSALAWAYAVARSAYLDRLRSGRREPASRPGESDEVLFEVPAVGNPEQNASAALLARVVSQALRELPEANRTAYVLTQQEGLSAAETAAIVGSNSATVRVRAHRAAAKVREALERAGWSGELP